MLFGTASSDATILTVLCDELALSFDMHAFSL
jgi:hypothetical protein